MRATLRLAVRQRADARREYCQRPDLLPHLMRFHLIFNGLQPGIAVTITSRVEDAAASGKEFRDGERAGRIAVSVDMLSTGYRALCFA